MQLSKVGPWVSIACAIHCMVSPIILGLLPMVHASEAIETGLIVVSVAIGVLTIGTGYREHHKTRVLVLLAGSLVFLGARFFVAEKFETAAVVTGAMLMAAAQFMNVRLQRHCCDHHHDHDQARRSELSSIASRV
jgi:hypothetical protein